MERWGAWPGQVSRGGTASSSAPGSGCVGTLGLWTRGSLCLCSERSRGAGKREEGERCYWKCYQLPHEHPRRPNSPTQSSEQTRTLETTLGGATSISPSILPSLCRKRRARLSPPAEGGLSNSSHSTGDGMCIFRSKQHLMKPWAPAPQEPAYR